ncbi:unnamed protein product [Owenia fusiformis]|uniref:Uncharacterized protein n=1 Tax=Owenia fusiformis TaxID=6347 RepID=A0A8J1XXH6_OWEFU|nr:unnamed protein product [Owenia fusiformis]
MFCWYWIQVYVLAVYIIRLCDGECPSGKTDESYGLSCAEEFAIHIQNVTDYSKGALTGRLYCKGNIEPSFRLKQSNGRRFYNDTFYPSDTSCKLCNFPGACYPYREICYKCYESVQELSGNTIEIDCDMTKSINIKLVIHKQNKTETTKDYCKEENENRLNDIKSMCNERNRCRPIASPTNPLTGCRGDNKYEQILFECSTRQNKHTTVTVPSTNHDPTTKEQTLTIPGLSPTKPLNLSIRTTTTTPTTTTAKKSTISPVTKDVQNEVTDQVGKVKPAVSQTTMIVLIAVGVVIIMVVILVTVCVYKIKRNRAQRRDQHSQPDKMNEEKDQIIEMFPLVLNKNYENTDQPDLIPNELYGIGKDGNRDSLNDKGEYTYVGKEPVNESVYCVETYGKGLPTTREDAVYAFPSRNSINSKQDDDGNQPASTDRPNQINSDANPYYASPLDVDQSSVSVGHIDTPGDYNELQLGTKKPRKGNPSDESYFHIGMVRNNDEDMHYNTPMEMSDTNVDRNLRENRDQSQTPFEHNGPYSYVSTRGSNNNVKDNTHHIKDNINDLSQMYAQVDKTKK